MIVGLLGKKSNLKAKLYEHLICKGFSAWLSNDLLDLIKEKEKNLVVDLVNDQAGIEYLEKENVLWISVGDNENKKISAKVLIDINENETEAKEKICQQVISSLKNQERPNWDEYFMQIAHVAAMRSNCIKRKVGAVIVRDKRIISTGYNGTPRGTKNCNEGGCPRCNSLADSGTKLDECLCSHAEENAITQAAYHGTSVKDGTIYTTFSPCLMCSKMIINSGIIEVVFSVEYPLNEMSFKLFEQAKVEIRKICKLNS